MPLHPVGDFESFIGYVRAFELAQTADAWHVLEPLFAEHAEHVVHEGGPLGGVDHGRAAVIEGLRQSVHAHDRRFDARIPEILDGPVTRPDGVWMRYALTLRRAGIPELRFEGEHLTGLRDGRIQRIEEWLPTGTGERVAAFVAEHGPRLRPAGSLPAPLDPRDRRDLEAAVARSLVRAYASAKSQRDVAGALALCSERFVLETPAFGTRARNREEARAQLGHFFRAFPDYAVDLEGIACGDAVAAWGQARLSLRGDLLGLAPTHESARLPIFSIFELENGQITRERFHFDRAALCEQLGLAASDVHRATQALRSPGP